MAKLISDAARDLIVAEEVSSKAVYEKRYTHPEWPGGASGITIGIGYDVGAGVKTKEQLWADWRGHIPDSMIEVLEPCIGVTGESAHAMLAEVRPRVVVPWDAAIAVFDQVDTPRWSAIVRKHLPNCDLLSPDSFGALVSLAYNRGPSFSTAGDRYTEMRAIKAHMTAREFGKIPAELRAMKRLWPTVEGLRKRRDHEADLFVRGLSVAPQAPAKSPAKPAKAPVSKEDAAAGAVVVGGATATVAAQAGHGIGTIIGVLAITIAVAVGIYLFLHWRSEK